MRVPTFVFHSDKQDYYKCYGNAHATNVHTLSVLPLLVPVVLEYLEIHYRQFSIDGLLGRGEAIKEIKATVEGEVKIWCGG